MRMNVGWLVCALMLLSAPAAAQYHGDEEPVSGEVGGALRFHVDVSMLRYATTTTTQEAGSVEVETTTRGTSFGTPGGMLSGFGNLSLGLGYTVGESIVIGSALQLGYESLGDPDEDDASVSLLSFGFAPYFEFMGGDSSTKPFIGATAYVRYAEFRTGFGGDEEKVSDTILGGGILAGAHFFTGEGCSIDLTGKITYGFGSGPDAGPMIDTSLTVLDVLVTLGVSAWVL